MADRGKPKRTKYVQFQTLPKAPGSVDFLKARFRFLQTDVISQESNNFWPSALLCSSVTLCLPSPHYVVVA